MILVHNQSVVPVCFLETNTNQRQMFSTHVSVLRKKNEKELYEKYSQLGLNFRNCSSDGKIQDVSGFCQD